MITISYEFEPYDSDVSDGSTTSRDVSEGRPKVIGDTPSHVMWFLQVSKQRDNSYRWNAILKQNVPVQTPKKCIIHK